MSMEPTTLSKMGQSLFRVRRDACQRRGVYRADRLLELVGDLTPPSALQAIGRLGRCQKALNPPVINAINYGMDRCQIRSDYPLETIPPTIGKAMHGKWRDFIACQRHHQGLKQAKPCGVEAEIDLPTLVAALGYDFEIDRLPSRLNAAGACSGSDGSWVKRTPRLYPALPQQRRPSACRLLGGVAA